MNMRMEEIWLEKDLAERLDLKIGKTGKSRTLSGWISEGLGYIEIYNRRYFVEEDITAFMMRFKKKCQNSKKDA